jgi:hypothetical protein
MSARPPAVSTIGWAWLLMSVLLAMIGTLAVLLDLLAQMADPDALARLFGPAPVLGRAFAHLTSLGTAHVLLGLAIGFASVGFLRARPWARAAIEAVSWIALVYVVMASWVFVLEWPILAHRLALLLPEPVPIPEVGTLAAVLNIILHAAPLAAILYYLRTPAARAFFESERGR